MNSELRQQCLDKIEMAFVLAESIYKTTFIRPRVSFTKRGRSAGSCNYVKNLIKLNPVLLEENGQVFVDRTPVHEAAHAITKKLYPHAKAHGHEWQSVMRKLGADTKRCHDFDTTNVTRGDKFPYKCQCKKWMLSSIRHLRASRAIGLTGGYRCPHCRTKLVLDEDEAARTTILPQDCC